MPRADTLEALVAEEKLLAAPAEEGIPPVTNTKPVTPQQQVPPVFSSLSLTVTLLRVTPESSDAAENELSKVELLAMLVLVVLTNR